MYKIELYSVHQVSPALSGGSPRAPVPEGGHDGVVAAREVHDGEGAVEAGGRAHVRAHAVHARHGGRPGAVGGGEVPALGIAALWKISGKLFWLKVALKTAI